MKDLVSPLDGSAVEVGQVGELSAFEEAFTDEPDGSLDPPFGESSRLQPMRTMNDQQFV